jgi:hydrogenase maturation protease
MESPTRRGLGGRSGRGSGRRSGFSPTSTPPKDREAPVGLKPGRQGTHTLVIGYGSPIRGDDAIGPLAADALAAGPLPEGVRVIARHVLTAELVEDIASADRVIFLDAAVDGAPGEVRVRELHPDETAVSTMAHFLDPRELLAWCLTLYRRQPRAWLISAAGQCFDYAHYSLSPAAAEALAPMLDQVQILL